MVAKNKNEEIKRNIKRENNGVVDVDQSVGDADGDREIEMDVTAEGDRIIDGGVEYNDFDENAKKEMQ